MSYNPTKPYKNQIRKLISSTWSTPYVRVKSGIYPVIDRKKTGLEVDHTDGIGTKGFYHWRARSFKEAVVDALAMNLNDLALVRAVPYKIQNHLTLPKDDHEAILKIIRALVMECKKMQIAMTGGETSIHDNSDSLDISITMTGIVKESLPNKMRAGEVLIGLKSSGLHSNGFTLLRTILGLRVRPEVIKPTSIYLGKILELNKKVKIGGMMHITGGGFTKLKDILDDADVIIDAPIRPQPIFYELSKKGIKDKDMYKTFNCGTGFVLSVRPASVETALKITNGKAIGRVVPGNGQVKIASAFTKNHQLVY